MKIQEDALTRYRYEVWFDYTRQAMNAIGEGAMIAVPNFGGNASEVRYSLLEVTGIMPVHYALGTDVSGYPGFVQEAARSAGQDWLLQEDVSTEDTTKIRCVAIPINLEIVEQPFSSSQETQIREESNLPMVGHTARLLDAEMTEQIANRSIDLLNDNILQIGALVRDEEVKAYLKIDELIQVHFGIFGFTGAGKSNLLSTLVNKMLTESKTPVKVVIFDLMSEYTGLLIDQLVDLPQGRVINVGMQTVPQSVLDYYAVKPNATQSQLKNATIDYTHTTILPKALKPFHDKFHYPTAMLLRDNKIVFWQEKQATAGDAIEAHKGEATKGSMGNSAAPVRHFLKQIQKDFQASPLNADVLEQITIGVEDLQQTPRFTQTAANNLDNFLASLRAEFEKNQNRLDIPDAARLTIPQIIQMLNDDSANSLFVIQAHDPDALREFAKTLIGLSYEERRKRGTITPLVSFIFDEADEFIPLKAASDSQNATKAAAMTLARRGRKFGLGLGISTQRVANLDVNILAQPHTYFVSKLPRKYDQELISNAFGMSEEMFRQTFKFKKGDWLLASYDAAGLEAIPIPIHAEDANQRIKSFIETIKSS